MHCINQVELELLLENVVELATQLQSDLPLYIGTVTLTQIHPAAPYVCRTGNITLRCQYGGVENALSVVWAIGNETSTDPSTIPGHTALPRTTTYQEIVVDSYTNLREKY